MKVLVIGGIAGGPSFATRLRRINEDAEIIIFERGAAISVASCALPYYLGGLIRDRSTVIERTPEILKQKNNIDVRLYNEVTAIDPKQKLVHVINHQNNQSYTETYDKLVIATGASLLSPKLRGLIKLMMPSFSGQSPMRQDQALFRNQTAKAGDNSGRRYHRH
ncbi:CoA-disulfide reductase [Lentilactobacillus farraginis DSM 18382 = JCM 14108]|uniref:CoA-disulfide reductase n=1 Tax=Lentilactobacillus farraginis DSM 18382 = JCM 14108 TaxID=1423743 RepID=X0P9C4_9LACO|nr:CoA-disulfide reductase [Lentilactobacillus farraginis DSM 18382 = JCM 14108]